MRIGSWSLPNPVFVAPMAGVTDRPYRKLCKALGAGYAVSEMAASNPRLWNSVKTSRHLDHDRSEEHPSELQSLMRISYAVFCLNKKNTLHTIRTMTTSIHIEIR